MHFTLNKINFFKLSYLAVVYVYIFFTLYVAKTLYPGKNSLKKNNSVILNKNNI